MRKRELKRCSLLLFVFLLLGAFLAAAGCGQKPAAEQKAPEQKEPAKKFINIATGGTAGTYYPLGGAIADILNKNIPGMNASAQSTGASVANINMLGDGSVDLAFVQNDIAYYAANGTEMFKDKKVEGLKGLATLYPETIQIVTLRQKNINSVADLAGKRVAVGAPGSGTEVNARQILRLYDIGYAQTRQTHGLPRTVQADFLSFAEAADQLKDGIIDAAFLTAGVPTAAVQDIAATRDLKIVPIPEAVASRLRERYPYYTPVVIPPNSYRGQAEPVPTVAVMAMLVTRSDLPEDLE
ncbi:TAXI family TRAP transporter solute-binding subunit [Alicyclobacillus sp.]|uniref:TAXI family TRAP transporter solute-binding subunit n=1 Tax=Alicyclobacillus sp. TaxID=61169 RepID=UPI0025BF0C7C|nr:TAXI family TRAP transporter solute-binding subunit [Alicyclobacillus sp.]MCL6518110.1 TAXI family TRAP transporter solute-binding subunit [Alicyclobacillus sp.]